MMSFLQSTHFLICSKFPDSRQYTTPSALTEKKLTHPCPLWRWWLSSRSRRSGDSLLLLSADSDFDKKDSRKQARKLSLSSCHFRTRIHLWDEILVNLRHTKAAWEDSVFNTALQRFLQHGNSDTERCYACRLPTTHFLSVTSQPHQR